jgi:aspartate 1-decarboxylase
MHKGKIHKAVVTQANLNYVGSITIDRDLMDGAGMIEGERVQIVNNFNGERIETYIIEGERGSGVICLNGAAARRVQPGDEVIIISYCWIDEEEAKKLVPKIVFVDKDNKIIETAGKEIHGENR